MRYLCDDFLNKHKRLIIEEFEAGFSAHTDSGGSLISISLFIQSFLLRCNKESQSYGRVNGS